MVMGGNKIIKELAFCQVVVFRVYRDCVAVWNTFDSFESAVKYVMSSTFKKDSFSIIDNM